MAKEKKHKISPIAVVLRVIGIVILVTVIGLCLPIAIPNMQGIHVYNVLTGSMEPTIPVGALVYAEDVTPSELQTDDIIAFYSADAESGIITHRVVSNDYIEGSLTTKGDANNTVDLQPVAYDHVIGKVTKTIPYLGTVAGIFMTVKGKICVAGCVVAALLLIIVGNLIAGRKRERG